MATETIQSDPQVDLPYPIFTISMDGTILSWNRHMEELTGVKSGDITGSDEFPDSFNRTPKQLIAPVKRSGKTTNGSLSIENGDDSLGEIDLKLVPDDDSEQVSVCVISHGNGSNGSSEDVNQLKQHIRELEKKNNEVSGIASAVQKAHALVEFDMDGYIQTANENFIKTMGYSSEDNLIGKHHRIFVDNEYAKSDEYTEFWNRLNNGRVFQDEFKRYKKSGELIYLQAVYSPVKNDDGEITKVIKIATDVTDEASLRNDLQRASKEIKDVMARISDGNMKVRVKGDYSGVFGDLKDSINDMADKISETLQEINKSSQILSSQGTELTSTSQSMEAAAEETTTEAQSVAAAADQADRNFQSISSATEQMSTSVQEIAKVVRESDESARTALDQSQKTTEIVDELSQSSEEIGSVVDTITTIAQQTKILALNATIEAARAGEAGKGFTVVANEVKELARQTTESAEEIAEKITGVQKNSDNVDDAIQNVTVMVEQMNQNSENISSSVEEQSITIADITKNIKQAAKSVSEISKKINSVADAAGETAKGAANTNTASEELQQISIELNDLVAQFQFESNNE